MSPAISSASAGGKSFRPTSVARPGSALSAAWVWTIARTAAAAVSGECAISRSAAATHRDLGAHTVGPEAVDFPLFQGFRRGHPKIDTGPRRPRHVCNTHVVAYQID